MVLRYVAACRAGSGPLATSCAERQALDVIHREEVLAFGEADFVNRDDVRVLQARGGGGFGAEALDEILSRQRPGQEHLHRDDAVQAHLPRSIDDAHPAARDFFQQFVITKATDCFCIGWSGWRQLSKRGNALRLLARRGVPASARGPA